MNPVALLVLQVTVAVKSPVQFPLKCSVSWLSAALGEHAAMNFRWFPPRRFLVYSPECETAPAPPSLRAELCETPPLLCCSVAWPPPRASSRRSIGFAPRLTTGLPFSLAHTGALGC